jgi:hypothetical protein
VKHPGGPRVIVHQSLPQQAKYLALSYVWGASQNYVLTKSTLVEKCSSLDLSRLPKTILDAIEITQHLGYSYLWVDALCIVQDSEEPDGGEIAVMGRIYQNSEVTIIAASAASSNDGFLKDFQPATFLVSPFDIPLTVMAGAAEYISVGYRSYYKPFKDPVNSRAWTLQERILSTRCLVYSYDGLKWGCGTCERNPTGPPDAPSMFPRLITREKSLEKDSTSFTEDLRQSWLDIRTEYTSRKLTYGEDKLKAISAIAFEFSKDIGWTYLAGLWKEHLFLDLQWHRDPESRILRPEDDHPANPLYPRPRYRAPSWSWASIDSPVVDAMEGGDRRSEFHFRILSCDITYWNVTIPAKFHFEPVRFGILIVEARMLESNWKWAGPEDLMNIFLWDREGEQGTEYIYGDATLDAVEPGLHEGSKVYCLALSVLIYDNRKRFPVEGILLVLANESETVGGDQSLSEVESQKLFRRAGFFKIYDTSMFNSVDDQIISVI